MKFQDATNAYLDAKRAEHIQPGTLSSYLSVFRQFHACIGDLDFTDVTAVHIARYLGSLQVSKKTALNHHTALSSLWRWAAEQDIVEDNIVRQVHPPKPEKRAIVPLSQSEINAMLRATKQTKHPQRDRALLLLFLDTGARIGEVERMDLADFNILERHILVMGKGSKERILPLSETTTDTVLTYLGERGITPPFRCNAPLFTGNMGKRLTHSGIRKVIYLLSSYAFLQRVNPHRLRHTFAIWYLRAGGNIYTLQKILGHSTLDMVKRYLAIAQEDVIGDHAKASPIVYFNIK